MADWDEADLFLVPLLDGGYGLGQVVEDHRDRHGSALCAFCLRRPSLDAAPLPLSLAEVVSVMLVSPVHLNDGTWPVVGFEQIPRVGARDLMSGFLIDTRLDLAGHDPAIVEAFLSACHGLYPWDGFPDPAFFDRLLYGSTPLPPLAAFRGVHR